MFHKIINIIKINYFFKKKNLKIKLNKNDRKIINILIKLNIISIYYNNTKTVGLKFNYINNNVIYKNLKNLYRPSTPFFINLKQIIKLNKKKNQIFVISSNKGLITNYEAEKYKLGGLLIFKVCFWN